MKNFKPYTCPICRHNDVGSEVYRDEVDIVEEYVRCL